MQAALQAINIFGRLDQATLFRGFNVDYVLIFTSARPFAAWFTLLTLSDLRRP